MKSSTIQKVIFGSLGAATAYNSGASFSKEHYALSIFCAFASLICVLMLPSTASKEET